MFDLFSDFLICSQKSNKTVRWINGVLPVKRTVKNLNVPYRQLCMQLAVFLCRRIVVVMILGRRHQMQIPLDPPGVIVANILLNGINQVLLGGKSPSIVLLSLQDAPEAFHGPVINAVSNPGHALFHVVFLYLRAELPARILESPVTMKQWMSIRLQRYRGIKSVHDQRIVIAVSDHVGYNPAVIEIQDGTQVYLVNFDPNVILKFCHIGEPFFVWCVSMKIPVKIVPCDVCRIIAAFGTTFRFPFDRGLDMFLSADPQNPFIIDINFVVPVQLIPYPAVSHIRMFFMDESYSFCDFLVSPFTVTDRIF